MTQTIPVKLSKAIQSITLLVSLTLVFIGIHITHILIETPNILSIIVCSILGALLCVSIVLAILFSPRSIEITDSQVLIHKVRGVVTINRSDILEVRRKEKILSDKRHLGSNGYLGFLGRFSSKKEGKYIAYVQDTTSMVYIRTSDKNYVVSCATPTKLIKELSQ